MMVFTMISVNTVNRSGRDLFGYKFFIVQSDSMSATDFSVGGINPGESVSHTVELTGEVEGSAELMLSFKENKNFYNKLAQYLHVTVKINGSEYCNEKLSELFGANLDTLVFY